MCNINDTAISVVPKFNYSALNQHNVSVLKAANVIQTDIPQPSNHINMLM